MNNSHVVRAIESLIRTAHISFTEVEFAIAVIDILNLELRHIGGEVDMLPTLEDARTALENKLEELEDDNE